MGIILHIVSRLKNFLLTQPKSVNFGRWHNASQNA